ncbi:unnamed protein product [Cochlearia groenlandica]
MSRSFSFIFFLVVFALYREGYAADSSSTPAMTSNTTVRSPPTTQSTEKNSTEVEDYSDYEVPVDLAPGGVEVVEDYKPINLNDVEGVDKLAQPEDDSNKKTNETKYSASSSFSSSSSSFLFFVALIIYGRLFWL